MPRAAPCGRMWQCAAGHGNNAQSWRRSPQLRSPLKCSSTMKPSGRTFRRLNFSPFWRRSNKTQKQFATRATPTLTPSLSGAEGMSRTGAILLSTRRRSTYRKRCTRRYSSTICCALRRSARMRAEWRRPTSFPTSTEFLRALTRPSSISTTRTGRIA
jgi:hypothetical protein